MANNQWIAQSDNARERVRAKIRYAQLMLNQLKTLEELGTDCDVAHEEACLSHLAGTLDAFLQELNVCLKLDLHPQKVREASIRKALTKCGNHSIEFDELEKSLKDKRFWLSEVLEYRNQGVHRAPVSRNYLFRPGLDSTIQLRHPEHGELKNQDRLVVLDQWIVSDQ